MTTGPPSVGVLEVISVKLSIVEGNPFGFEVSAVGSADAPPLWNHTYLSPVQYVTPPADGIQDFNFLVGPPDGTVSDVALPISAEHTITAEPDLPVGAKYTIKQVPAWCKGVRILGGTNSMVAYVDTATGAGG